MQRMEHCHDWGEKKQCDRSRESRIENKNPPSNVSFEGGFLFTDSGESTEPGTALILSEWRGASGRRNKALREVKHHVPTAKDPFDPSGVVPPDEGTRLCGR